MSYSDFKTLEQINTELGIVIKDENKLYVNIEPVKLSNLFVEIMKVAFDLAIKIDTEMARQSFIVDNVLMELKRHIDISFFVGNAFNVDKSKGLTGNPDSIITNSDNQLYITSPVVILVEAKKSDLGGGYAQCIAEMEAARIFNERKANNIPIIYGVVTDGVIWRFISLHDNIAVIDSYLYNFGDGSKILGILKYFLQNSHNSVGSVITDPTDISPSI
ncbi:hypothetical protein [Candidatus Marithrix sp. Canyon 246]|nr:hypothetical protein [Candidatus Marithrix sp. Canyon 246]